MSRKWFGFRRSENRPRAGRGDVSSRPGLEGLESRLLLYSTLGANWTYGNRITYSFVPDGTNIGGLSSNLFSTMNAKFSTATWEAQFQKAAAAWEAVANINLVNVSDNGATLGSGLYQQGDPNMGDIRISMVSLPSSQLAFTFLPPPINGGSDSGDIVFNSNVSWQINSTYDVMTVALHEFGHALGMDHSALSTAVMYATYTGTKQALTTDDISGIQSIYGAPQNDVFDSGATNNNNYTTATNITSYLNASAQISLPSLNLSSTSDNDWFYVTAPATTTGTMTVTMQSSNLSSLSPRLVVYTSALGGLASVSAPSVYGATVTVTITGVTAGQSFYLRSLAASSPCAVGAYGLLVNFGSSPQAAIAPPNTQVLDKPDAGGGSSSEMARSSNSRSSLNGSLSPVSDLQQLQIGQFVGWGDSLGGSVIASALPSTNTSLASSTNLTAGGVAALTNAIFSATLLNPVPVISISSSDCSSSDSSLGIPSLVPQTLQAIDDSLTLWNSDDRWSFL